MDSTNLGTAQRNNTLLADLLNQLLLASQTSDPSAMSDQDKFKAAYALNLCTVSVSQIIDYNDVNFLEYEYEVILNNLNLEEIPKDEALLSILKQLLDVITYFRIQDGEKKLLEKEYQQKMKNAIWNAVPNFGLIVAGGNPVTMAISLASQIGIGYMNYRKEKAKIGLEQERKAWELQRSAMEQFNGLRRELFDTAWRLADKYNFPDKYRLTERQITQFNRILMDADDLRRYERLDYISEKFEAYPPFWYYLGNAANAVCQKPEIYGPEICADYKQKAIEAFRKFRSITKQNLLREDQLKASCALELFDIWDDATKEDRIKLLKEAQDASGNAFDVLQLCALAYMRIDEADKASELFRMLVNEGYNTNMNAQILSKVYVMKAIEDRSPDSQSRKDYKLLQMRVGAGVLFPMPSLEKTNYDSISEMFMEVQRQVLREKCISALTEFVQKHTKKYELICQENGNISTAMIELLENMCSAVRGIVPNNSRFSEAVRGAIEKNRNGFQVMLTCDRIGVERPQTIKFSQLTKTAFTQLAQTIRNRIDSCNTMILLSAMEADLDKFCIDNDLYTNSSNHTHPIAIEKDNSIALAIFSDKYQEIQDRQAKVEESIQIINSMLKDSSIVRESAKAKFYLKGDTRFENYLNGAKAILSSHRISSESIVAIIQDERINDQDLLICIDGIRLLERKKYLGVLLYRDISQHYTHDEITFGKATYKHNAVDMGVLHELTNRLAAMCSNPYVSDNDSLVLGIRDTIQLSSSKIRNAIDGGYVSVLQYSLSDKDVSGTIKELKRVSDLGETRIQINGKVIDGSPRVGSYCKLVDQEGIYVIERIGYAGNLTASFSGQITKFTLREV